MLKRVIITLVLCMSEILSADEIICESIPENIAKVAVMPSHEIDGLKVEVQLPKFYESMMFHSLTLNISPETETGNRTGLETDLGVNEVNGIINSDFEISNYAEDVLMLNAGYIKGCVSTISMILRTNELTNLYSNNINSENKTRIGNSLAFESTSSKHTYSFSRDKILGGMHSGSIGEFVLKFHDETEFGGYTVATLEIRKKKEVKIQVDILKVRIYNNQCESKPVTELWKGRQINSERFKFPNEIAVTEPSCIDLQFLARQPYTSDYYPVDIFQVLLVE